MSKFFERDLGDHFTALKQDTSNAFHDRFVWSVFPAFLVCKKHLESVSVSVSVNDI